MSEAAKDLAVRIANATRKLARVRQRLMVIGQAGGLLKADVYLYETARRTLVDCYRHLSASGRLRGPALVPPAISKGVLGRAAEGRPSMTVMFNVANYASRLRTAYDALPTATNSFERGLLGMENEVRIVVCYVQERERDSGLAAQAPAQVPVGDAVAERVRDVVNRLQTFLESPQGKSAVGLGIGTLLGAAMLASGRYNAIPTLIQQGTALADMAGLRGGHAPHARRKPVEVEAKSVRVPPEEPAPAAPRPQPPPQAPEPQPQVVECDPATKECRDGAGKVVSPEDMN